MVGCAMMDKARPQRIFSSALALMFFPSFLSFSVSAEIVTDGSLGAATTLSGPEYQIDAALGKINEGNLFHSFNDFSLGANESATFTGPASINNVINRVTGGDPSSINGLIQDTFTHANFYFINPAGVMFGPNASLNLSGSFFVSSADYLRMEDGTQFFATSLTEDVTLTSAAPQAFGFLDADIAPISFQGSWLTLAGGETLGIVGGDITIEGSYLQANESSVQIASGAAAGEIVIQEKALDASQISTGGEVQIIQSQIDTYGASGGDVYIRGGDLVIDNSTLVNAYTLGSGDAGDIVIEGDSVQINNGTALSTESAGDGNGGSLTIHGDSLLIDNGSAISSASYAAGSSGNVVIDSNSVTVDKGSIIYSGTQGIGNGGKVTVTADSVLIDNGAAINTGAFSTGTSVQAGDISISADTLTLSNGSDLRTQTLTDGKAGNIRLDLNDSLNVQGESPEGRTSRIVASAGSSNGEIEIRGNAGNIDITTKDMTITDGGLVVARTFGAGTGGNITVKASNEVLITGTNTGPSVDESRRESSGIGAESRSVSGVFGDAGNIKLDAKNLTISESGFVSVNVESGSGKGGNINLNIQDSLVMEGVAQVDGRSLESYVSANVIDGKGEQIEINAENVNMSDGAQIQSIIKGGGSGGNLVFNVENSLIISGSNPYNDSYTGLLSAGKDTASGKAGDISINAGTIRVLDGGVILSNVFGSSKGGDIELNVDGIFEMSGTILKAFSGEPSEGLGGIIASSAADEGTAGRIEINAGAVYLKDGARLFTSTSGTGSAGNIDIKTTHVLIEGLDKTAAKTPSAIAAESGGLGNGGDINVTATTLMMNNGGRITSKSNSSGLAGDITVNADDWITLRSGASITALAKQSDGGEITVNATSRLWLRNATITTSVGTGNGKGGNITIDPIFVILDGSTIQANAFGGTGGDISINANHFISSPDSVVEAVAKSEVGVDGSVVIDSPDKNISGRLKRNAIKFFDKHLSISTHCSGVGGNNLINLKILPSDSIFTQIPQALRAPRFELSDVSQQYDYTKYFLANNSPISSKVFCLSNL